MILMKIKFNLLHPYSIMHIVIFKLESNIKEDGVFNNFSIFDTGNIQVEIDRIFSKRVNTKW